MVNSRIPADLHGQWQQRLQALGLPRGNAVAAALRSQVQAPDSDLIRLWQSERTQPRDPASHSLSARIPSELHDRWIDRLESIGLQSRTDMVRAAIRQALALSDEELVLAVLAERRKTT